MNWPLSTLREKIPEIPKGDKKYYVYCQVSEKDALHTAHMKA